MPPEPRTLPRGPPWAYSATSSATTRASSSATSGLALERGRLGAWLVGQEGAILVRPGGHRVHCFCVRVGEAGDLPPADRVAHLLLALREDERGFATVANRNFSGATWRLRVELPKRVRPALRIATAST